ncbi:MAG: HEPN domain-containing protein [Candidatus Aenigmarchaeota archaeon]|nr:HEPN domain-containing protein [Candidatus Aenigmarchaeota archaeon]
MGVGKNVNRKEFAKAFLIRARADLKSANALLKDNDFADAVYHAQQCAEKAIKAHLILENRFAAVHVISPIYVEVSRKLKVKALEKVLSLYKDLEMGWIRPRYPFPEEKEIWNPVEEYKKKDAEESIKKAGLVFSILTKYLKEKYGIEIEKPSNRRAKPQHGRAGDA